MRCRRLPHLPDSRLAYNSGRDQLEVPEFALHATTIRCYCMNSTGTKSTLATGITVMSAVIVKILCNAQSKFTRKLNINENEEKDFFRNL
jgi:hypothetical protein